MNDFRPWAVSSGWLDATTGSYLAADSSYIHLADFVSAVPTNDPEVDDNLGLMRSDAESSAIRSVEWIRWMKQQRPRHGLQSPMIQRGLR